MLRPNPPKTLTRTLARVVGGYVAIALTIALAAALIVPFAGRPRMAAPAFAGVLPSTSVANASVALALEARDERVSRSTPRRMPQTVIERAPRMARRVTIKKITWVLPVGGYHLTGRFGDSSYLWSSGMHTGLDFAAPAGTPIRSVAAGVVKEAGYAGAYGYRTVVTLPSGGVVWYCHQTQVDVRPGQRVSPGQVIGSVGSTGNVTGAHLHMEVRPWGEKGRPVDPYAVLAAHGLHA